MKKYYFLLFILFVVAAGLVGFLVYRAYSTDLLFAGEKDQGSSLVLEP